MMDWVDYVILGLLALAALHGWRTGAVRQVLSFGGFWLGLVLGVIIAPPIARLASPQHRGLVAMIVLLVTVLVLASLGDVIGSRVARVLRRVRLGIIDDGLGIGVAVVATLLVVWLIGNLVSVSQITSVDRGVQNSVILRAADGSLPTVPALFTRIESFLAGRGFPVVFVNLPAQVLPAVAQPTTLAVRAARNAAGPSTVKVTGSACGAIVEGSGFVVAPQLIVTNAHVVAGDGSPRVVDGSGSHAATPVWFDPKLDVAVLEVPGLSDPPLQIDASTVARGTQSAVLGFPEDGGLTIIPSAIDGAFPATGLDIYGNATVTRKIYQLHAAVRPGNSGGPLVSTGHPSGSSGIAAGTVIGLVFARSTSNPEVGYALAMGPVEIDIHLAEASRTPVSTGACTG